MMVRWGTVNTAYVTKIKIRNVRHLKETEIPLSENEMKHLIITGKNGSGKTSLLEAMRLFLWFVTDEDTSDYLLLSKIENNGDPLKIQFDTKILGKSSPESSFQFALTDNNEILRRRDRFSGIDLEINGIDLRKDKIKTENFIFAYYPAERTYSVSSEKVDKVNIKNSYKLYEHPGKNFVKYLKELTSQEALFRKAEQFERADKIQEWLNNFTNILRRIFDNKNLSVNLDIEQMKFFIEEPGKNPFSFDELASGYAAILDIITDLMMRMENKRGSTYDVPGIVLIDEVDAHLHLSLQKNILPTLTTLFKNIQFIVTTHSPFVLNSISNTVVYNLETKTLVNTPEGLSLLPYSGIVEGYFGVSELSKDLKEKFERYKELAKKNNFTDDDYNELGDLESYLDEIPDFLALDIMSAYRQIKLELEQREEAEVDNG